MRLSLPFFWPDYSRRALLLAAAGLAAFSARAELSPAAYKEMQDAAPEQLVVKITTVKLTPGKDGQQVDAQAIVVEALRTATKVKAGDTVTLTYAHAPLPSGMVGPGPVPIVGANTTYTAFLEGGPPPSAYAPAARSHSFVAMENTAATADPGKSHDFVPATLISEPGKNRDAAPAGLMASFAREWLAGIQLTKQNGHWFAKISTNTTAVPLLAGGDTPPTLLAIAPVLLLDSMARMTGLSPESQKAAMTPLLNAVAEFMHMNDSPIVLVYRAGTATLNGAALTVERAVIYVQQGDNLKPLGDALWAVRAADGTSVSQQPLWHLTADKLTVDNPFEKTAQEISLVPKSVAK